MKKLIWILMLMAAMWASGAWGADYYAHSLSVGGDGTTQNLTGATAAFKTIDEVNGGTYSGDDQIFFQRGQRWAGNLNLESSGTDGHPIVIDAYGSGNNPEISGTHTLDTDYLTLRNINIRGLVTVSGSNVIISNGKSNGETRVKLWDGQTEQAVDDNSENTFGAGVRIYGESFDYPDILTWWDYFTSRSFSGWTVTKSNLGKDASGTIDIYAYIFTPAAYDRTVLINTGMHAERASMLSTFRFFYYAISNNDSSSALAVTRRVRYVVIPCLNPWILSNAGISSHNANGVNINRNFNYGWDACADEDKGSSAESEAETQILLSVFSAYSPDVFLDFHSYGVATTGENFIGVYPVNENYDSDAVNRVVYHLTSSGYTTRFYSDNLPFAANYAADNLGIPSFIAEYAIWEVGDNGTAFSSKWMTGAVKWFGNLILAFSQGEPR